MRLIDYLNALPEQERDGFAMRCKTSVGHLRQVGYGNRTCAEKLAINIERETNRVVMCEELRSDVDWDYIRSTKKIALQKTNRTNTTEERIRETSPARQPQSAAKLA